jgi:exosome complex exonuclease DIS3/RRP44
MWEMTPPPEAKIVKVDFHKSIIHSVGAYAYAQAQLMLDDPSIDSVAAHSVRRLHSLAKILRQRRMDAGALTLASPEVRFKLDTESHDPTDVQVYALQDSNALVEEFMLLANITVGKKVLRHFPMCSMLRRHPSPSRSQFDGLLKSAKSCGFDLCVDSSKVQSINSILYTVLTICASTHRRCSLLIAHYSTHFVRRLIEGAVY